MMDHLLGAMVTIRVRCREVATVQEVAEAGSMDALVRQALRDGLLWVLFDDDSDAVEIMAVEPLPEAAP